LTVLNIPDKGDYIGVVRGDMTLWRFRIPNMYKPLFHFRG